MSTKKLQDMVDLMNLLIDGFKGAPPPSELNSDAIKNIHTLVERGDLQEMRDILSVEINARQ